MSRSSSRAASPSAGIRLAGIRLADLAIIVALVLYAANATAQQRAAATARPRYSHAQHAQLKVSQQNCKQCHQLDGRFDVMPPLAGKDHQPCADANCHATEFFSKQPRICVVCHDGAEPWKKLGAALKPVVDSEFGRDISHVTHARAAGNAGCKGCHGDPYRGTPAPRGHAACASCHGKTAEPAMGNCGDCHRLGETVARARQPDSEWSVAASFSHLDHGRTPGGDETDCVMCHERVPAARSVTQVANPTMQSCDGCHDGNAAFKTTGFECYRCHAIE